MTGKTDVGSEQTVLRCWAGLAPGLRRKFCISRTDAEQAATRQSMFGSGLINAVLLSLIRNVLAFNNVLDHGNESLLNMLILRPMMDDRDSSTRHDGK